MCRTMQSQSCFGRRLVAGTPGSKSDGSTVVLSGGNDRLHLRRTEVAAKLRWPEQLSLVRVMCGASGSVKRVSSVARGRIKKRDCGGRIPGINSFHTGPIF